MVRFFRVALMSAGALALIIVVAASLQVFMESPSPGATEAPAAVAGSVGRFCDKTGTCATGEKKVITRADWGAKWPLTVDSAVLACLDQIGPMGQVIVIDGAAFAANGATQTYARAHGLTLQVDGRAEQIKLFDAADAHADRLWAKRVDDPAARADWGPVISALQDLGCKSRG